MYNTLLSDAFVINNNLSRSIFSGILTLEIPLFICAGKLSKPFITTSVIILNNSVTRVVAPASPGVPKIVCCVTTGLCLDVKAFLVSHNCL